MIPLPSDGVNYDILCSASLYNDLDLLDESFRNVASSLNEPFSADLEDVFGSFYENDITDIYKSDSFETEKPQDPIKKNAFIGQVYLENERDERDNEHDNDLQAVSPFQIFGPSAVQETQKQCSSPSGASPSYIADHDHCYSIVTKPSDSEKSPSLSVSSESPSEVSSSEEEVDVITVPTEPKEQLLLTASSDETSARSTRGRKNRTRARNVMSQITLPKSSKVPVKVRSSRSSKQKTTPGPSPVCSDDDFAKRKEHNYSERQRRRDQQNLLQTLRRSIPHLETVVKAPKVRILDTAREYILSLKGKVAESEEKITSLKSEQVMLLKALRTLCSDRLNSTKSMKLAKFLRNKL